MTNPPRLDTWEKDLKHGLLNQSCDRLGDGISAFYRIGQTSTLDWMTRFISDLLAAQDRASREDERRRVRKKVERLQKHLEGHEMDYAAAKILNIGFADILAFLPVEGPTPSHEGRMYEEYD